MCGCAHRGMRPRRCSGHCRMTRSGSSCAGPTKMIARRQHDQDRQGPSLMLRISIVTGVISAFSY